MARPFLLLEPGPLEPDEPHQRGDSHLLEVNCLGNIANAVLSGRMGTPDYQSKVVCLTDWRRKGGAYDLAPLGQRLPSSARPEFKPLPHGVLERAFTFQPGGCRLTEADKGDLLQTNIGGFSTPATTAASGGVNTTAPSAGLGGPTGAAPPKIKLKVKKDKKRRRDSSEQLPA